MSTSPTIQGFRTAFRQPSLTLAEIVWRWTVGATAAALSFFLCIEYLRSLPVTRADAALLSTGQPGLIARALHHILQGSSYRVIMAALIAALAISILWVAVASIGRVVTVRALLDSLRVEPDLAKQETFSSLRSAHPLRALMDLNVLRVAVMLGTVLSVAGCAIVSSFTSSEMHPRTGLAILVFLFLAACAVTIGWSLDWWLSLAAIFAVRDRQDALGAMSNAVSFFREHSGAVLAVSLWTGFAHIVAFSIATTAATFPFIFIQLAPRLVTAVILLVTLAYFAVVDWVYVARVAGYIYAAENPTVLQVPPLLATTIDRDERILSDLPSLGEGNMAVV